VQCYLQNPWACPSVRIRFLALVDRVSVGPGRRRWEIEALCLQLVLHLLDGTIKLLIFAFKFFSGVIIDHDIRIDSVSFDYPLFAVFGINCELRFEELPAIDKRQRFANASYAAPAAFADELA